MYMMKSPRLEVKAGFDLYLYCDSFKSTSDNADGVAGAVAIVVTFGGMESGQRAGNSAKLANGGCSAEVLAGHRWRHWLARRHEEVGIALG